MTLYRSFYEAKGWEPGRINAMTPMQLAALCGVARKAGPSFPDVESAVAWMKQQRASGEGKPT